MGHVVNTFVGVDPAVTKGVALVALWDGGVRASTSPVFKVDPPRRLVEIRRWVTEHTPADTVCALVEGQFQGRVLPAAAAVCVEGVAFAAPHAVVLEMVPSAWRKALTGFGRMDKEHAMELAELYGVPRQDDLAEALCMALVAKNRWTEATTAREAG